jgi:hypothetical protein
VVVVVSENEEEQKIIPQTTKEVITEENTTTITTNSSTINHSKAYFNFVNSINSPATRKTYEFAIKKYMQYYGL